MNAVWSQRVGLWDRMRCQEKERKCWKAAFSFSNFPSVHVHGQVLSDFQADPSGPLSSPFLGTEQQPDPKVVFATCKEKKEKLRRGAGKGRTSRKE